MSRSDNHTSPAPNVDNAAFVDDLYLAWRADPRSVPADWAAYFSDLGPQASAAGPASAGSHALATHQLLEAYRALGHRAARVDPLGQPRPPEPRLSPRSYGLSDGDLGATLDFGGRLGLGRATLREFVSALEETYCGPVGIETMHLESAEARTWLLDRIESSRNTLALSGPERVRILERVSDAEAFEQFLHTKFIGEKRFSIEGGEGLIPLLDRIIEDSAARGVEDVVIGMAHRGRLNVLTNVVRKPAGEIFRGFLKLEEDGKKMLGSGDVKYHLGHSADVEAAGRKVHLSLAFNPSHLEAIYPVVEGRVRARQDRMGDSARAKSLPLVLHGDASFAGQGVLQEVLNYSGIAGYRTGGTIHVVVNNQVGFTTLPGDSRSAPYATNLARMLDIPILHVNGEDPGALAQAARLAVEYRQKFRQDVVIDLVCFRKHGHNEGDEPRFTQPVMYRAIDAHPGVRARLAAQLVKDGVVSEADAARMVEERKARLDAELTATKNGNGHHAHEVGPLWAPYAGGRERDVPDEKTGLRRAALEALARKLVEHPADFEPNPKLVRGALKDRGAMAAGQRPFDWGTAENLAFASLLSAGHRVRLSGQDAMRGTFTQRHAVYFDHRDGRPFAPLCHLGEGQGRFEVRNSPLSEFGVLGFDYGYSLDAPDALVIWEAQFGDFANGAQVIIDQFLSSAEDKWNRLSGLVLLLPHGFEGQGPEHSSARLERFLSLSAEDNWQVVNLTTPAQYFHALRRQVVRRWRKPLVVMTPKSLLRHPEAVSGYEAFEGTFQRVLGDETVDAAKVRRVLLCSGKVYYDLAKRRAERKIDDTAIVRVEQLYPYPHAEIAAELKKYPRAKKLVWVQEEPWNMGAWFFLRAHDAEHRTGGLPLECASRPESASPATGHPKAHEYEQRQLLDDAFGEGAESLRAAST
jgi:2-oxoglutarate dehydrogenase E1 component